MQVDIHGQVILGTGAPQGRAGQGGSFDAEREVLVVDFLVRTVGFDFCQGFVQVVAQLGVTFAHGNADLVAVHHRLALELEVRAVFAFQPLVLHVLVGQDAVDTTGDQVEVGVFLGVVQLDVCLLYTSDAADE